jgi:hypothetical protein
VFGLDHLANGDLPVNHTASGSAMERNDQPQFTGNARDDLVSLARCLRAEGFVVAAESPEPLTEDFSVGVNDGESMLVSCRAAVEGEGDQVSVAEIAVSGLAQAGEALERQYWGLAAGPFGAETARTLEDLDRQLLQLYWEAAGGDGNVSFDVGVHTAFEGTPSRARWSLFVQNEVLRKLVCAAESDVGCAALFLPASVDEDVPRIVGMSSFNPFLPVGLCVPRAVQQLRAQCLDPDGIVMARRGLALRADSPAELWQRYRTIVTRIEEDVHARLRHLPWIFQNTGDLLDDDLVAPAAQALADTLGDHLHIRLWESSRAGILRKVACADGVLDVLARGFPDFSTAAFGGIVPLVVRLDSRSSAKQVAQRVSDAWEDYRQRHSEKAPLRFDGVDHRPGVIIVAGLGVWTAGPDEPAAHRAYVALSETVSVLEGARAFGGMRPLPYDEALCVAAAPGRYPRTARVVAESEAEFVC